MHSTYTSVVYSYLQAHSSLFVTIIAIQIPIGEETEKLITFQTRPHDEILVETHCIQHGLAQGHGMSAEPRIE
jgi:hypothetical protein